MVDTAKCPYCGYENDMAEALNGLEQDDKFDWECEQCEQSFRVRAIIDVSFDVSEIAIGD